MAMLLRALIALVGVVIVFLGLDIGLGGIRTLNWQGGGEFLAVTDPAVFAVKDNHMRFIGGVWLGVGLTMLAGAFCLRSMQGALIAVCAMVFVGGLARLSAMDISLLTSAQIAPSLVAELVLFPLLALWIWRAGPAA